MYEPFTRTKTVVCARQGRWSQTSLYHVRIPVDACDPCSTDKAVIWRHFISPVPVVPSPKDHEWGINVDEQLVIQWMGGATAPDTALQLMFSMCKGNGNYQVAFTSTMIRTAQICAKLQTSSNQPNEEEPVPQLTDRMKMKL